MKMAGTGATLPSTPGAQRVLETPLIGILFLIKAIEQASVMANSDKGHRRGRKVQVGVFA
jgi:hypothetical protein